MKRMTEQDGSSLDTVEENLRTLKAIFPETFTEDGVDFEMLRQLLGDTIAEREEKYGFNWYGKKEARQIALMPSIGTLRPCPEESIDWDITQNLFVEGDNLEVLKLLQKSYANRIKMIYIDPPYNSGKEFIYPDRFQDNLDTYLKYTGQKDDKGFKMSSNTESSGRYHTNWLNMMYPRLKLSRNLLRDDGLILLSIDDNEVASLRKVCDEIFGEENFLAQMVWKNKTGGGAKTRGWIGLHEYIICFAKNSLAVSDISIPYSKKTASMYRKKDEKYHTRGPYATWPLDTTSMGDRPNLRFPIYHDGVEIVPEKQWLWSQERVLKAQEDNILVFNRQSNGSFKVRFKGYLRDENGTMRRGKPLSILEGPYTQEGSKDFQRLLPKAVFPFPKPTDLLANLFAISTDDDSESNPIFLDFFAGSGTTAQAVLNLNKEDGGNRRFIMVQLPEPCDEESEAFKTGFKTIADIGKERIRRAAAKIKEDNPEYKGDLGFKVFRLSSSNIRAWNPDRNDMEQTLIDHMEHLVENRSEKDVLYELLLKRGVDLTVPIEERVIAGKVVYSIGYGVLLACLDTAIGRKDVEGLALGIITWHKELGPATDTQVVFRDSAFPDDIAKTNMTAILEQHDITHVRSL